MWDWLDIRDPSAAAIFAGAAMVLFSVAIFVWAIQRRRAPREIVERALVELQKHAAPSPLAPGKQRGTFEIPEASLARGRDRVRVLIRSESGQRSFDVPHGSLYELEHRARELGYVVMYRGDSSTPHWDLWTTG